MNNKHVMVQALAALQIATTPLPKDREEVREAIAALQAAIAQQEVNHITWNAEGVRTVNGVPDFVEQPPSAVVAAGGSQNV